MYQLTQNDLDNSRDDEPPAIRAAQNPNPAVLQALLTYSASLPSTTLATTRSRFSPNASISGAIHGAYSTPLIAAIHAHLPENIHTLLSAGANPNGISTVDLADYATRFIRGRAPQIDTSSFAHCPPRSVVLASAREKGIASQTCALTPGELAERRAGFPRFWTEPNVPAQRLRSGPARTALEVAASYGDVDVFELLRAAGADESAWLVGSDGLGDGDGEEEPVSWLSTSSPIHEALRTGQVHMLRHLLARSYSANYRPLAAPTLALPPVSFAIARCELADAGVQACLVELLSRPGVDLSLRTPVFGVHVLHFAAARHDPDLLRWVAGYVSGGLAAAGRTALGQTLLHVACLPLVGEAIVSRRASVARSLHCARTLDETWCPYRLPSPLHARFVGAGEFSGGSRPMEEREQRALRATVKAVLDGGAVDVRAPDVDGNTALHYLAGTLNVDEETVEMVRGRDEEVWEGMRNHAGFTPRELWGE